MYGTAIATCSLRGESCGEKSPRKGFAERRNAGTTHAAAAGGRDSLIQELSYRDVGRGD